LAGVLAVDWLAVSLTRGLAGVFLDGAAGIFPVAFVGDVLRAFRGLGAVVAVVAVGLATLSMVIMSMSSVN
jgi:hypothetical protein